MQIKHILTLLILVFILNGCANKVDAQATLDKTYKSSDLNFSFNYPSNWDLKELSTSGQPTVRISSPSLDSMQHSVVLQVIKETNWTAPQGWSLAKQKTSLEKSLKTNSEILGDGDTLIDGHDAFYILYQQTSESGALVKSKMYVTIIDSKEYGIYYSCYDPYFQEYLPLAERIVSSFVTY